MFFALQANHEEQVRTGCWTADAVYSNVHSSQRLERTYASQLQTDLFCHLLDFAFAVISGAPAHSGIAIDTECVQDF